MVDRPLVKDKADDFISFTYSLISDHNILLNTPLGRVPRNDFLTSYVRSSFEILNLITRVGKIYRGLTAPCRWGSSGITALGMEMVSRCRRYVRSKECHLV